MLVKSRAVLFCTNGRLRTGVLPSSLIRSHERIHYLKFLSKQGLKMTKLDQLPKDILISIFGFFNRNDMTAISRVSKRCRDLSKEPQFRSLTAPLRDYTNTWTETPSNLLKTSNKIVDKFAILTNGNFLSLGSDGILQEWNWRESKEVRRIDVKGSSKDFGTNHLLALTNTEVIICVNNIIYIWDIKQEKYIKKLEGHDNNINTVLLLHNGNLVTCSSDKTIRIWDLKNYTCLFTLNDHINSVKFIAYFPKMKLLVSAATRFDQSNFQLELDPTIRIWNYTTGVCIKVLTGHKDDICFLSVLNDSKIIIGYTDKKLHIWDINKNILEKEITLPEGIPHTFCALPNNKFACGTKKHIYDSFIYIYDLTTDIFVKKISVREQSINVLEYLPNNYLLCNAGGTVHENQIMKIWDMNSWEYVQTLSVSKLKLQCKETSYSSAYSIIYEYEHIAKLAVLPNYNFLVGTGFSGLIKCWRFPELKPKNSYEEKPSGFRLKR